MPTLELRPGWASSSVLRRPLAAPAAPPVPTAWAQPGRRGAAAPLQAEAPPSLGPPPSLALRPPAPPAPALGVLLGLCLFRTDARAGVEAERQPGPAWGLWPRGPEPPTEKPHSEQPLPSAGQGWARTAEAQTRGRRRLRQLNKQRGRLSRPCSRLPAGHSRPTVGSALRGAGRPLPARPPQQGPVWGRQEGGGGAAQMTLQCPGSAPGPRPSEQPASLPPSPLVGGTRPGGCQRQCMGGEGATRLGSLEGHSEALRCPHGWGPWLSWSRARWNFRAAGGPMEEGGREGGE